MEWIEKRMTRMELVTMNPLAFRCFSRGLGNISGQPWLEDFKKAIKQVRYDDPRTDEFVWRWLPAPKEIGDE